MIIGFRRALERHLQQGQRMGRKSGRKDGVAFDDAGIAVRGLLARRATVEERHRKPALGQMQPDRGADDASTEDDSIHARHDVLLPNIAPLADAGGCNFTDEHEPSRNMAKRCRSR